MQTTGAKEMQDAFNTNIMGPMMVTKVTVKRGRNWKGVPQCSRKLSISLSLTLVCQRFCVLSGIPAISAWSGQKQWKGRDVLQQGSCGQHLHNTGLHINCSWDVRLLPCHLLPNQQGTARTELIYHVVKSTLFPVLQCNPSCCPVHSYTMVSMTAWTHSYPTWLTKGNHLTEYAGRSFISFWFKVLLR